MNMALMDMALTLHGFQSTRNDFDADAVTSTIKRGQMAYLNANRSLFSVRAYFCVLDLQSSEFA